MNERLTWKKWIFVIGWWGITLLSELVIQAIGMSAEAGALAGHLRYSLYYNLFHNTARFAFFCALCFVLAYVEVHVLLKSSHKYYLPAVLLALFFAGNTLLYRSKTGELVNLVGFPGASLTETVLCWVAQTGSWYALILLALQLLNRPMKDRHVPAVGARKCLLWAGTMFLCWLPILILRAPGSIYRDSVTQILQFRGAIPWEASNPVLLTVVYGCLFSLGKWLGGDNIGIAVCVLFQVCILLAAFSFACREVAVERRSIFAGWGLCLFFGIMPVFASFAGAVLKDTVHAAVFLLFAQYLRRCTRGTKGKDVWILLGLAILCAATRKGAVYLVLVCLCGLLFLKTDIRRLIAVACCLIFAGHFCLNEWLFPAIGVEKPMERENYSLFYFISAYYCARYDEELSQEEKQIIADVLDYGAVHYNYSPERVDIIKSTYHAASNAQVWNYIKLHGTFLMKHPFTVLDAVVHSRNWYYTPWSSEGERISTELCSFQDVCPTERSNFYRFYPEEQRQKMEEWLYRASFQPIWRELVGPGIYTWLSLILYAASVWQKDKRKEVWLLSVLSLTIGFLFANLNGSQRYAFPLIVTVPVLLMLFRVSCIPNDERNK